MMANEKQNRKVTFRDLSTALKIIIAASGVMVCLNILVFLITMLLLVGILSGCTEETGEEEEEEEEEPTLPTADFTYEPMTNITNTTQVNFTAVVTAGDATNLTYLWDFGDEYNSTESVVIHSYDDSQNLYKLILTVNDGEDTSVEKINIHIN